MQKKATNTLWTKDIRITVRNFQMKSTMPQKITPNFFGNYLVDTKENGNQT